MKLLLALLAGGVCLAQCTPGSPAFKTGRDAYYRASQDDKDALSQASRVFEGLYKQCPKDPAVLVYFGSLRLKQAANTWALWKKNSLSKEGIEDMDAAVEAAPANLEIRFVRAATTYNLPAFFHRKQQSQDDFAFLAQRAEPAAQLGQFDPALAAASLYFHAEFLHSQAQDKQAAEAWQLAIRVAPRSRAARDSENELKRLRGS